MRCGLAGPSGPGPLTGCSPLMAQLRKTPHPDSLVGLLAAFSSSGAVGQRPPSRSALSHGPLLQSSLLYEVDKPKDRENTSKTEVQSS